MLVGFIKDITQRKKYEEKVINSLKEKELLLREIHHRVKNNLQIVSSILYLQSEQIKDKNTVDILLQNIQKLRAMALVHDFLYQSENLVMIDFKQYILKLASLASDSFTSAALVRINVNTDQEIPFEKATYVGLLITELLINSMKYAFVGRSRGEINITLTKENGSLLLTYADNGIGFSSIQDMLNGNSFGTTMIKTLVKQLKGNLEFSSQEGVKIKLFFPYSF